MNAIPALSTVQELPANLEVEQGLLGAILLNNRLYHAVAGFLRAEHFQELVHRAIFTAIGARVAEGRPASALTLASDLPPLRADVTPAAYLAHITASAWSVSEQIVNTARELVFLAGRRQLVQLATDVASSAMSPGASASDIIARTEVDLIAIANDLEAAQPRRQTIDDFHTVTAEAEHRMVTGNQFKGPRCGLTDLDERLGGFAPGEFVVLGGRPGSGKTALATAMLRRAAHIGVGSAFDSIEMPGFQVRQRLISDECASAGHRIAYRNIARGRLTVAELAAVKVAATRLTEMPMVIIDRGDRLADLPGHIRAARRSLEKRGKELELFFIDYLGLLRPSDRYAGQRTQEVGEISAAVKSLAKREGIAIIALHQLNRSNTTREDRRPRMDELRDSGSLEQDADVVMFVHREAYYIERPGYRQFADEATRLEELARCQRDMEVIIAKQRQGPIGTVKLDYEDATNAVRDAAR